MAMNSVRLIGRVQHAPRYYCTAAGRDLTRITLAVRIPRNRTVLHECVAWGGPAFSLYDKLRTGDLLAVEGKLRYRSPACRKDGYIVVRHFSIVERPSPSLAGISHHATVADTIDHADQ